MNNRFLRGGFTAREIELIWARCLSHGGTDPIWEELQAAFDYSRWPAAPDPKETS